MGCMDRHERVHRRAGWPIRLNTLGHQDPARMDGPVSERLRAVETLTRQAWTLARLPLPDYARHETPVRVVTRSIERETTR